MNCEKCGDRGFTEQEHGLVMVLCDCEKGKELRAEITGETLPEFPAVSIGGGIPEGMEVPESITETSGDSGTESVANFEVIDDSNSGTGQPDTDDGGGYPGQPKLKRKPKSKKKARKKLK